MLPPFLRSLTGSTLIEALVALGLLVTAVAGLGQLFVQSAALARQTRNAAVVLAAAEAKLEQLRALVWSYDSTGGVVSDLETDTSVVPPAPSGGTGLGAAPGDSLDDNFVGYVDYLDETGRSLGTGATAVADASYARRWHIAPLQASPDVLGIQVCVVPRSRIDAAPNAADVCLCTARARRP